MEETLRELFDKEISDYQADFLEQEEKENAEILKQEHYDKLFHILNFDNRVTLIKLENCYKQIICQKQKEAFIKGFSLAMTYMIKKDK